MSSCQQQKCFFIFVSIQKPTNTFNLSSNSIYEIYIFYFSYIFYFIVNLFFHWQIYTYLPCKSKYWTDSTSLQHKHSFFDGILQHFPHLHHPQGSLDILRSWPIVSLTFLITIVSVNFTQSFFAPLWLKLETCINFFEFIFTRV